MAAGVARLAEIGGGQVALLDGRVIGEVPLPIGGLMSNKSATEVAQELRHLTQVVARALGVTLEAPFMQLSFLGLSVIPELRITDRGLVDVMTCSLTDVGAV
jgi:adenine deaminase